MKEEIARRIMDKAISGYEKIAEEFSASRFSFWKELTFVKNYIKEGDKILDVGCGNGRFLELIKEMNVDYTGVDTSEKLLKIARQKYPSTNSGQVQIKFIRANALELPFKNGVFDTVVSFAVLHHIPSKNYRKKFIDEAFRVLKKDGILILTVWNLWQPACRQAGKNYLPKILKYAFLKIAGRSELDFKDFFLGFGKEKDIRYLHAFTKRELENLVERSGFTVKKISENENGKTGNNIVIVAQK